MNSTVACTLPALVLTVLATAQIYHSQFQGLTPWKGAGFGMFSSIQRIEARFLKVYLVGRENREHPVSVPNSFWREDRSLRAWPTQYKMESLAKQLISPGTKWGQTLEPISPTGPMGVYRIREEDPPTKIRPPNQDERASANAEPIGAISVRLELWRYTIDPDLNRLIATKWMETAQSSREP